MKTLCEEFTLMGETGLINQKKTVFFSPFDVSNDIFHAIREWINSLDPMAGVIVCGNSSGIERFTLRLLLQKGFGVILPLATTIPSNLEELNLGWKLSKVETLSIIDQALAEHRLLLVSSVENVSVSTPTGKTLSIRNEWMRDAGDVFVVARHTKFDYYDRLLLGKTQVFLTDSAIEEADDKEAIDREKVEATRMGWDIYRILRDPSKVNSSEMLKSLIKRYWALDLEHPSLLHSLILMVVSSNYSEWEDFDYLEFLKSWSIQNLRPEDWESYKNSEGKYLPSLAERCLTRMIRKIPSRNMLSLNYGAPYDTRLAHEWIDAAIQHSPKNLKHIKKALKLAYYEHDTERIQMYKKQLAI